MRRGLRGSLVGAVALLLAPAAHGDVWSPPRQVSTEPASGAIAAVAANGGAVVAWAAMKGQEFGQIGSGPGPIAFVTRRARGDAFTAPAEIAANSFGPRAVGAGDDGLARVLWPRYEDGAKTQLPETPAPLAEASGPLGGRVDDGNGTGLPRNAEVAVGRDGTAVAMWLGTTENSDHTYPVLAARRPAGGSFGTARALGSAFRTGSVAVDANGLGLVAW